MVFLAVSWVTGSAGRQTQLAAHDLGPGDGQPQQLAAVRRVKGQKAASAGDGDGVDDQTTAGAQPTPARSSKPRGTAPSADENRVGRARRPGSARAPRRARTSSSGTPSRAALARSVPPASASRSMATAPHATARPQPLDGDAPGTGADVPEQLAVQRRQCRQGHGADLRLGQLAVMLVGLVRQAGHDGQHRVRRSATARSPEVQVGEALTAQVGGGSLDHPLGRPGQLLQDPDPAAAVAASSTRQRAISPGPTRRR